MITTKIIVDEELEHQYFRDRAYLQAEKETMERTLMQELFEEEQRIRIGKERKRRKPKEHARIIARKIPRYLQPHNRSLRKAK